VRGIDGLRITRVWGDEKETPGSEKDSHRAAAPRLSGMAGAGGEHRAAGRGRVLSSCFFHPYQAPTSLPPERLPWTLMRQISRRSWSWPCMCSDTAWTPPRSLQPTSRSSACSAHRRSGPWRPQCSPLPITWALFPTYSSPVFAVAPLQQPPAVDLW
jgi:hypothetical protein